jgi:transcriptional regulator with XRE-family HTH domain
MNSGASRPVSVWLERKMKDPEFRAAAEELEPSYQVARLRMLRGWTQKELARRVGTKQSSIARLESGKTQPRISFLRRIIEALDGHLEIRIVPKEEARQQEREETGEPYAVPITVTYEVVAVPLITAEGIALPFVTGGLRDQETQKIVWLAEGYDCFPYATGAKSVANRH